MRSNSFPTCVAGREMTTKNSNRRFVIHQQHGPWMYRGVMVSVLYFFVQIRLTKMQDQLIRSFPRKSTWDKAVKDVAAEN